MDSRDRWLVCHWCAADHITNWRHFSNHEYNVVLPLILFKIFSFFTIHFDRFECSYGFIFRSKRGFFLALPVHLHVRYGTKSALQYDNGVINNTVSWFICCCILYGVSVWVFIYSRKRNRPQMLMMSFQSSFKWN